MDKLVVFSPESHVGFSDEGSKFERIEASVHLQPGTYWRCKQNPTKPDNWNPHRYWSASYEEGEILLLMDVKDDASGFAHNVTLLLTPERQSKSSFGGSPSVVDLLTEHFFRDFELAEDGEKIRQKQTQEHTNKLLSVQQDIADIQSNPQRLLQELATSEDKDLVAAKERLMQIKALPSPEAGTNLVSLGDAADAKSQLEAKVEIAKATAAVLEKSTQKLSSQISIIGNYHGEIGHLALARTKEARDLVKRVGTALDTLAIYMGTEVDVFSVAEGESGSASEKFKLYQNMLYMDEESLIHAESGGADHSDVMSFFGKLAHDKGLVDRIFPFNRCIVIMRPRRRDKDYSGMHPFESMQKNRMNKLSFLLIRNGENIHAVSHPMGFMTELFPSQTEMESCFQKGAFDCRNVTKEDLEYTDSLEKMEKLIRQYKRVVLMLQGIYERDESGRVFGELPINGPLQLMNQKHQSEVFDFVSMENVIEDTRMPPYSTWFKNLNSDMRVGSLVCILSSHINSDTTPAAYTNGEFSSQVYELKDRVAFSNNPHVLEKHGQKIGVKVPFSHYYHNTVRNMVIEVNKEDRTAFDLEKIRSSDIDYYLNSRRERVHYAEYISTLQKLKNFALVEERRTESLRKAIAGIIEDTRQTVDESLIFQAVMKYRANCKGRFDENAHTKKSEIEKVLNVYWQLIGGSQEMVENILKASKEPVVAIVADANNAIFVYTRNEERALEWDETGFPWLSRWKIENKTAVEFTNPVPKRITEISGKVSFLYRSDDYADLNQAQQERHILTMRQVGNWNKKVESFVDEEFSGFFDNLELMLAGNVTSERFAYLLGAMKKFNYELRYRHDKATKIQDSMITIPVGTLVTQTGRHFAMRAKFKVEALIDYFVRRAPDGLQGKWLRDAKETISRTLNTHHADQVGLNKERITGRFYLSQMHDAPIGNLSLYYDANSKEGTWKFDKSVKENYSMYAKAVVGMASIQQVYGIDKFLNQYPNLSSYMMASMDDKIESYSLKDFRSAIEMEKSANKSENLKNG